jgi:predicted phage baseplate assembly protein
MKISESCQDLNARRRLIRAHTNSEGESDLNGIDYLEVDETQRILTVFFLGKAPEEIRRRNVVIEGGARVRNIRVEKIRLCRIDDPERDDCLKVFVDRAGDFSTYRLKLVNAYGGESSNEPLDGFDPRYAQLEFSFKANCPTDLDCQSESLCAPEAQTAPEINYLAKDYASFRQLILDRLALVMPQWKERHVPDLGIALVELLAYTGDYLSYYQDAVGCESYLDTARRRISVRRHATLVDYLMREGSNSRAWVCVEVNTDLSGIKPQDIYFTTRINPSLLPGDSAQNSSSPTLRTLLMQEELQKVPVNLYEVFEPLAHDAQPLNFYQEHNSIHFYTWQDTECCLPRGATSATLVDDGQPGIQTSPLDTAGDDGTTYEEAEPEWQDEQQDELQTEQKSQEQKQQTYQPTQQPQYPPAEQPEAPPRHLRLKPGDVLVFEEVLGPNTGREEDADPTHRHAVRLTKVEPDVDSLMGRLIVNIEWSPEDALPFNLCLSSVGRAPDCVLLTDVSVARGNVALCDHGRTVWSEKWRVQPEDEEDAGCVSAGEPRETILLAANFRPALDQSPLTHGVPLNQSAVIARRQAKALNELMKQARSLVVQLLKQARRHVPLSQAQLDELKHLFGEKYLAQVGFTTPGKKGTPEQSAAEQAAALERLLSGAERFLEKKRKRLDVLRRRALSGYVLTELEHQELAEMFGESLIVSLGLKSNLMLGSATAALQQNPRDAVPCIIVYESQPEDSTGARASDQRKTWTPVQNMLGSGSRDRHFVAEIDDDGVAQLRFGNNDLGRAPTPGSILQAMYRVGQGRAGNIGAEAITQMVFSRNRSANVVDVLRVRNPLPTRGGTEPEPTSEVKLYAPSAFRKVLQRAITSDDYASLAASGNANAVQQAAASLRWSGSWYEIEVAIDPRGTEEPDGQLLEEVSDSLAPVRRIGHDLAVKLARYVPLHIELSIRVLSSYLRGHVKAALLDLFSNRRLPNGQSGLFHPDNLSFGDDIYLSKLVAAAQAVPGVQSVTIQKLERLYEGSHHELEEGVLPLGPLEVAQLDNDPSFPERGKLLLTMRGGR